MTSIRHVGIVVSDMEASLCFYCDFLGLQNTNVFTESGPFLDRILGMEKAKIRTAKLVGSDGPTLLELLAFDQPETTESTPLTAIGPTHVALSVSDLDQIYQRMIKAGVVFNAPPALSADASARVAFCRDPDGSFVELVESLND
jgi:catechol 2,3-dioxygenase-like lactoylglutathione lyase family enzyme